MRAGGNPLVSVVLPLFNAGKHLHPMLDSLRGQHYRPLQVVLVDDGSTDGSVALAEAWARTNFGDGFGVELHVSERNRGLSAAVSKGCAKANGIHIAFADQDDVWDPGKLAEQVSILERDERTSLVLCDRRLIDDAGRVLCPSEYGYVGFAAEMVDHRELLAGMGRYSANTMVVRSAAIQSFLPVPVELAFHDFYLALAASKTGSARYIHRPLVDYRIHPASLSGNYAMELSRTFAQFQAGLRKVRANRIRLREVDSVVLGRVFNHGSRLRLWEPNPIEVVPALAQYCYWKFRGRVGRFAAE